MSDFVVTITEKAAVAALKALSETHAGEGDGLRVAIRGGGCAGYQYALDFSHAKETDLTDEQHGLKVYIDPMSAIHLEGTTIDYITSLLESGFKFINPNAKATCGCGSSFT